MEQLQLFLTLENQINSIVERCKEVKKENTVLELEKENIKEKLTREVLKNRALKDENERLKMVNAMLGEKEHRRLMKLKINRLIKEIDLCIAQVKR